MKTDAILDINSQLSLLKSVSDYMIAIEIIEKESTLAAAIIGTDGTVSNIELPVEDIFYFSEFGTINLPPRPIIRFITQWVQEELSRMIDKIMDGIFLNGWTASTIEEEFRLMEARANGYISVLLSGYGEQSDFLRSLLSPTDPHARLIDFTLLKNHLRVKIYKK